MAPTSSSKNSEQRGKSEVFIQELGFEGCDAVPTAVVVNWMHHPESEHALCPGDEEELRRDFSGGQHMRRMGSRKVPKKYDLVSF